MTTTDVAENWRDLVDQLTPEQLERMEHYDADPDYMVRMYCTGDAWDSESLLACARDMVRENKAVEAIGDVPWPPDAVSVEEWVDAVSPEPWRPFKIAIRKVGDVEVQSSGLQGLNGADDREITVHGMHPDDPLNAESARALAAVLLAAAEDLERAEANGWNRPR